MAEPLNNVLVDLSIRINLKSTGRWAMSVGTGSDLINSTEAVDRGQGVIAGVAPFPMAPARLAVDNGEAHLRYMLGRRWAGEGGLLGEMCQHALVPMGKLFRPILLMESTLAVGGRLEHVLPAAVGTESGHVASLVHDDIIDDDEMRRGRAAVHTAFGAGNAIVAGDALLFDLFHCLAECREAGADDGRIVTALEVVSGAGLKLCQGQSLEFEITADLSRDLDRYVLMIKLKTGALFVGACQAGAVLGGGTREEVDGLGRYGDELGVAFQMCDDLFTYTSQNDKAVGKSLLSDIRNKRMTLPVILAYRDADAENERLLDAAFGPELTADAALELVENVMDRTGAIDRSRELAMAHAIAAKDALAVLRPSPSRDRLADYAERAVNRIR